MKVRTLLTLGIAVIATAVHAAESRVWNSKELTEPVTGVALALQGDAVVLRRDDGIRLRVALDKLSPDDQTYLREHPPVEAVVPVGGRTPQALAAQYTAALQTLAPLAAMPDEALVTQHEAFSEKFSAAIDASRLATRNAGDVDVAGTDIVRIGDVLISKSELITTLATLGPIERRVTSLVTHLTEATKEQANKLAEKKASTINYAINMAMNRYRSDMWSRQAAASNLQALASGSAMLVVNPTYGGGYERRANALETYTYTRGQANLANAPVAPIQLPDFVTHSRGDRDKPWEAEATKLAGLKQDQFGLRRLKTDLTREVQSLGKMHASVVEGYLGTKDVLGKLSALTSVGSWDGSSAMRLIDRGLADPDEAVRRAAALGLTQIDVGPIDLSRYCRHKEACARVTMLSTLPGRNLKYDRQMPLLLDALDDPDPAVRQTGYRLVTITKDENDIFNVKRYTELATLAKSKSMPVLWDLVNYVNDLPGSASGKTAVMQPLFKSTDRELRLAAKKTCDPHWKTAADMEMLKRNVVAFANRNGRLPVVFTSVVDYYGFYGNEPELAREFHRERRIGDSPNALELERLDDILMRKGIGGFQGTKADFFNDGPYADIYSTLPGVCDGWGRRFRALAKGNRVLVLSLGDKDRVGGGGNEQDIHGIFNYKAVVQDPAGEIPWEFDPRSFCKPVE